MLTDKKGYTFLELMAVLVLLGLIMAITVPRFRYTMLTDDLKSTTRKLVGIIKNLRSEAMEKQEDMNLNFDLDSNLFWIDSADMSQEEKVLLREKASSLPGGGRILDVLYRDRGKKMAGETAIRFNKKGYVQESLIHLGAEDGGEFTLVLTPFLGRVEILEGYEEYEEM